MSGLKSIIFKNFVTLQRGFDLPSNKRIEGQYPVVASTSITGYHNEYKNHPPGVVTGRSGALGEVQYIKTKFWALNTTLWVKDFKGNHPKYVYYFLKTLDLQRFNSGAGVPTLNRNDLDTLEIKIHPLPIQRAIASILSNYDDLIENNNRRIKILEEMAKTIYQEWFVKFRFPNHENVKMVESELGLIPEGWQVKELGDIATDIRRSVNPAMIDPKTPYFGLEHLPRKSIALNQWGNAEDIKSSKLIFKQGEILFGKIRPYFHKVGVAPVNGICSSDIIVIYPKSKDYFALTMCCVSSDDFIAHATQTSQGTKMPRANWDVLIKYPILVPTMDILSEFNIFVDNLLKQIHNLTFKNINLRKTRDLLLPKLISGEIDVENLDINTERLAS